MQIEYFGFDDLNDTKVNVIHLLKHFLLRNDIKVYGVDNPHRTYDNSYSGKVAKEIHEAFWIKDKTTYCMIEWYPNDIQYEIIKNYSEKNNVSMKQAIFDLDFLCIKSLNCFR